MYAFQVEQYGRSSTCSLQDAYPEILSDQQEILQYRRRVSLDRCCGGLSGELGEFLGVGAGPGFQCGGQWQ